MRRCLTQAENSSGEEQDGDEEASLDLTRRKGLAGKDDSVSDSKHPCEFRCRRESKVEPQMCLDGGMNHDRVGKWGSDVTGQGCGMGGEVPVTMF